MKINVVGPVKRNFPFGTEIAFMKGFLRLGHEVAGIDPSEQTVPAHTDPDFTLIFKTGHQLNPHLAQLPGPKIVYQPDDLRFPHIQQLMQEMRSVADYALTFDDDGAKELIKPRYGYKKARTLLLTADPQLYRPLGLHRDLDFVFVGSLGGPQAHYSRRRMVQLLAGSGFKVHVEETYDIPRIVELYNRAKVVLNHATNADDSPFGWGYGYQCRHFEAGMTGACLLSNAITGKVSPMYCESELNGWVDYTSEQDLLEKAKNLIGSYLHRDALARELSADIRKRHMPEHRAQEVIDFVRSL